MAKIKDLVVKVLKEEVKILTSRLERWDEDVEDGLWKVSGTSGLKVAIDVIQGRIDELETFVGMPNDGPVSTVDKSLDGLESGTTEITFDQTEPW